MALNILPLVIKTHEDLGKKMVMDKTLTPSPWTAPMDYPKMDYT